MMRMKPKIGIRPIIEGQWNDMRETVESQAMMMAKTAARIISDNLKYPDGTPVECEISETAISGGVEAAMCAEQFSTQNICGTLSVTPFWCYSSEIMDIDPLTIKAVWGFNGTDNCGAVFLAAVLAAHAQDGLPAFSIYSDEVRDCGDYVANEEEKEKILSFAACAVAVGLMRNKAFVSIGAVTMGIRGSCCEPEFFQKYLGMRTEWVDMTEILRRIKLGIYDAEEYYRAIEWAKKNCKEGFDKNPEDKKRLKEQKVSEWEFIVKMALIMRDIMKGNPKLNKNGWHEEALGRNAIAGGFQGQRMWTDWLPTGNFAETMLNSTFDWDGRKQPVIIATENDSLNAVSMLFANLLSGRASVFADIRTCWKPDAVERITGWKPTGFAENGFLHLMNSGSAALDATGLSIDDHGNHLMKQWWDMNETDINACLRAADWCAADLKSCKGGGFSCHFKTETYMPVTLLKLNLVDKIGPVLQIAE